VQSTNRTFWITLVGGLMLIAPAFAQRVDNYRAQIRGGGGDRGKCTIEVDVDGVAEIEIRGDQGVMRTLSGNPSAWRRMECNQPLPPNPYDFRFSGVDGRGRQTLLHDPANNRGTAVVRIEDPQGGREGYTFDIEWRGTGGYSGGGGIDRGQIAIAMTGIAVAAAPDGMTKFASAGAETVTSITSEARTTGFTIAK